MNMKVKTAELSGAALDYAVAQCEGLSHKLHGHVPFSTDWAHGGPLIDRELIALWPDMDTGRYFASADEGRGTDYTGDNALIAGLRCYVASKRGEEMEIPQELLAC